MGIAMKETDDVKTTVRQLLNGLMAYFFDNNIQKLAPGFESA